MPMMKADGLFRKARGKGRPPDAASAVGREVLVAAAVELLRTRHPDRLSAQEVARFAGVDPTLIRYYFGGKTGLFAAVAAHMRAELHARTVSQMPLASTAEEKFALRIKILLHYLADNPNFHQLIFQQVIYDEHGSGKHALAAVASRGLALTKTILDEGQAAGTMRAVDPRFLQLAIVGLCGFFVSATPLVKELFETDQVGESMTEAYEGFLIDLLTHGLASRPEEDGPR